MAAALSEEPLLLAAAVMEPEKLINLWRDLPALK
jgi:hypothetical protein